MSVECSIVLVATSIWAIAIPVLTLFSVIEGQLPEKRVNGQFKVYSFTSAVSW